MKKIILAAAIFGSTVACWAQDEPMPGINARRTAVDVCADFSPVARALFEQASLSGDSHVVWSPVWDRATKRFVPLGAIQNDEALMSRLFDDRIKLSQAVQSAAADPALAKRGWPLVVEHVGKTLGLDGVSTSEWIPVDPKDPTIKDFMTKLELVNQITIAHLKGESCTPASFDQMRSTARARVERQSACTIANIKLLTTAPPTKVDCDLDNFEIVLGGAGGSL